MPRWCWSRLPNSSGRAKLIQKTIDLLTRSLDMSRVMIELPGPWISDVRSCDIEDMKKALVNALGPDGEPRQRAARLHHRHRGDAHRPRHRGPAEEFLKEPE